MRTIALTNEKGGSGKMSELQGLADDLQGESFALLTIDLQEDAATIGPFRRELGCGSRAAGRGR